MASPYRLLPFFREPRSLRAIAVVGILVHAMAARAVEVIRVELQGAEREITGRIVVEAQDGGLLLESADQRYWVLQPDQIRSRSSNDEPFQRWDQQPLGQAILRELPAGFQLHTTEHYVIAYNTSKTYARWAGALFEQLHRAFFNHWNKLGWQLERPQTLVAVLFRDHDSYVDYGREELGDAASSIIGFYSLTTNRITTYDLTGLEALRRPGDRIGTTEHIQTMLSRPEAERTIATVIHEATHQLAFNSGMQTRFADNPLWVSEGLAIYFESPDLSSRRGWRKIGAINQVRLAGMRDYLPRRPHDSFLTLLTDDQRFRNSKTSSDAYAESWSLVYFLMRQQPQAFVKYLQAIGAKEALGQDSPEQRLAAFKAAFGEDVADVERNFLRAVSGWSD